MVTGNTIHDIHVRRLFSGAEMAGIKFHAAIDVEISHNHIYRTCRGLWLDWMAQGTRVSANLFHDNRDQDLFVEVDHGPFLVDNNIFLSPTTLLDVSQGGAYVHNLIAGGMALEPLRRPHDPLPQAALHRSRRACTTTPAATTASTTTCSSARGDLGPYDAARLPVPMDGNVFLKGAKPCKHEKDPLVAARVRSGPQAGRKGRTDSICEIHVRQGLGRRAARGNW